MVIYSDFIIVILCNFEICKFCLNLKKQPMSECTIKYNIILTRNNFVFKNIINLNVKFFKIKLLLINHFI